MSRRINQHAYVPFTGKPYIYYNGIKLVKNTECHDKKQTHPDRSIVRTLLPDGDTAKGVPLNGMGNVDKLTDKTDKMALLQQLKKSPRCMMIVMNLVFKKIKDDPTFAMMENDKIYKMLDDNKIMEIMNKETLYEIMKKNPMYSKDSMEEDIMYVEGMCNSSDYGENDKLRENMCGADHYYMEGMQNMSTSNRAAMAEKLLGIDRNRMGRDLRTMDRDIGLSRRDLIMMNRDAGLSRRDIGMMDNDELRTAMQNNAMNRDEINAMMERVAMADKLLGIDRNRMGRNLRMMDRDAGLSRRDMGILRKDMGILRRDAGMMDNMGMKNIMSMQNNVANKDGMNAAMEQATRQIKTKEMMTNMENMPIWMMRERGCATGSQWPIQARKDNLYRLYVKNTNYEANNLFK